MSEYGLLTEVRIRYRGSVLTEAASIGDSTLVVDYAGDFNNDPDDPDNSGGTLDLNGARLEYTSVAYGELPDDPDTILLATPLAAGADIDDSVYVVTGGQLAEDWEAYVTMGEGDAVVPVLTVDQRNQWPAGVYDDPVPVILNDDLTRIEDAPGRTAVGVASIEFRNTDTWTITDAAGDQAGVLTYEPRDGSEHVHWHPQGHGGIHLPASAWSRVGRLLTVAEFDGQDVDDTFTCEYAYFPGQRGPLGPTISEPDNGESVSDTTPTITGTGEPGFAISVDVDGGSVGSTTVADDGAWSVTVGSALDPGGHTIVATETSGSFTATATSDFTTPAPTPPTPSVIGHDLGSVDTVADTITFDLPAGTAAGDLIVLTVRGQVASGGGELINDVDCSDPRMDEVFVATTTHDGHVVVAKTWVGLEDGSGDPVVVDVTQNPSYNAWANGVLATITGVHGYGVVSATEAGTSTPVVSGVAAVAAVWLRANPIALAVPPSGYTDIAATGSGYYSADLSIWYDAGGSASPAGTFAGEGCCVIAIT